MGKMNASDKIMFKKLEKDKNGNERNVYTNLHLKDCLDRIHSLLRQADIIYCQKVRSRIEYVIPANNISA